MASKKGQEIPIGPANFAFCQSFSLRGRAAGIGPFILPSPSILPSTRLNSLPIRNMLTQCGLWEQALTARPFAATRHPGTSPRLAAEQTWSGRVARRAGDLVGRPIARSSKSTAAQATHGLSRGIRGAGTRAEDMAVERRGGRVCLPDADSTRCFGSSQPAASRRLHPARSLEQSTEDGMLSFEPNVDRIGAFQLNKAQTPLQLGEI